MAKPRDKRSTQGTESKTTCPACRTQVESGLVHCNGSPVAYGCTIEGAHHGRQLWEDCFLCGKPMGCVSCVPGGYMRDYGAIWKNADLLCKRCRVKTSIEALLNGGPVSRWQLNFGPGEKVIGYHEHTNTPDISVYPKPWIQAYNKQVIARATAAGETIEDNEFVPFKSFLDRLQVIMGQPSMRTMSRRNLQRERNRQVAELVAAEPSTAVVIHDEPGPED